MTARTIPLDDERHRLGVVRFMANGVLLATRFGERSTPQNVLHAWTVDAAQLSCTPLWGSALPAPARRLVAHDDDDGGFVATSDGVAIHLWDRATGVHVRGLGVANVDLHAASAGRLWLTTRGPDGVAHVVVAGSSGALELQATIGAPEVLAICPLADGALAAVLVRDLAARHSSVHVCGPTGTPPRALLVLGSNAPCKAVGSLPNGRLLVMLAGGPAVIDTTTGVEVCALHKSGLSEFQTWVISPDGRLIATIHAEVPDRRWFDEVSVHIWDLAAKAHVQHILLARQWWPETGVFTKDGQLLLARGGDALSLWNLRIDAQTLATFDDTWQGATSAAREYVDVDRVISSMVVAEDHDPRFDDADRARLDAAYPQRDEHARALLAACAHLDREHSAAWRAFLALCEKRLRALAQSKETDRYAAGSALYNWASWASGADASDVGRLALGIETLRRNEALIDQLLVPPRST